VIRRDFARSGESGRYESHPLRHPSPNARYARGSGWQAASRERSAKDVLRSRRAKRAFWRRRTVPVLIDAPSFAKRSLRPALRSGAAAEEGRGSGWQAASRERSAKDVLRSRRAKRAFWRRRTASRRDRRSPESSSGHGYRPYLDERNLRVIPYRRSACRARVRRPSMDETSHELMCRSAAFSLRRARG
jgi:hypothetical protein